MKNMVTVDWLKNNLDKKKLVIFDVRHALDNDSYGMEEYKKGHIPNAIFIPFEEILAGDIGEHGGRHPLPDMKEFAYNMNKLGVDDESIVVAYDDGDLSMAGRLWFMLKYIGFQEAYVLLGGFKMWKSKNYPITTEVPEIVKGGDLSFNLQENMVADVEDVKKAINNKNQVIVDSRVAERYRGEIEPIDKVPGHIPSAVNFPWTDLARFYEDYDESKIKEHYKDLAGYDKIIVHCGSGITATVNLLFMEAAGLSPIFYVGGYSDWISYEDNEVVKEI